MQTKSDKNKNNFSQWSCCGVHDDWVCSGLPDRVPTYTCNCSRAREIFEAQYAAQYGAAQYDAPQYDAAQYYDDQEPECKPVQNISQCNFNENFPGETLVWTKVSQLLLSIL